MTEINTSKRAYQLISDAIIAAVVVSVFIVSSTAATPNQVGDDLRKLVAHPVLAKWHNFGGAWQYDRAALTGVVDGTSRGFAIADDAAAAGPQTIESEITPIRHIGDSWSAGGICLYAYTGGYWRLALAESPDKRSRYAELTLMNEGVGVGDSSLHLLSGSAHPFDWKWNTPYRLLLKISADSIRGEVFTLDGVSRWSVAYALTATAFVRFGWPAVGVQGMQGSFRNTTQSTAKAGTPESVTVRCEDLVDKQSRSLWLSLPNSRLVVNPTMVTSAPAPIQVTPWLPLNVAYHTGPTPVQLPFLWGWRHPDRDIGSVPLVSIAMGPKADFSPAGERNWRADKLTAEFGGSSVRLSVTQAPFGSLSTEVSVDLDRTPTLMLNVHVSAGQWALKVNSGSEAVDTFVQRDTKETGSFIYDIAAITGWHGKHRFKLILFAIGNSGSNATVSGLRFAGVRGDIDTPTVFKSDWYPQQIVQQAADLKGAIEAKSQVCLPDENTVAQKLTIQTAPASHLTLTGQLPPGKVTWDEAHHSLVYQGAAFQEVMIVSRAGRWLGQYDSFLDQAANTPLQAAPADGGTWAVDLDGVKAGDEIVVTSRFAQPGESTNALLAEADKTASVEGFQTALARQEQAWNLRLSRVPTPIGFTLHSLSTYGVTADAIRRTYFKAWVFLLADILPPLKENGYNFPQVACGKPSLWSEGAIGSEATSQWESFLGIQDISLVDPQTAWDAFTGEMSIVGEDGSLGGEGLPSRHAQTAWILYSLTGDLPRLRKIYPNLKRLLMWKAAHPRWIYHNATPEDQKDSEFVVHALMDMEYAKRIAHVLVLPAEEQFWDRSSAQLAKDYNRWFWDGQGRSYRLYRTSTGKSEAPDQSWNLEGLVLPPQILIPSERDSLLSLYRASVHLDMPFLISALSAFPKYNFTIRGAWQYARPEEAALMAESAMRDITLAGEFSENYTQKIPPTPDGVTPSIFGAAQIIDSVLWHNGVMLGDGLPVLVRIPHSRGVCNLLINGKAVDVLVDEAADRVVLQGAGLASLKMPAGFTRTTLSDGIVRWDGKVSAAAQIPLERAR